MTATGKAGDFEGKVAFITGAAGGIGRATALAFARAGASVTAADVSEPGVQETARMIEELGGQALAVRCDVTQSQDVQAALAQTVETFGRLDAAFNNAGVEQPVTPTADIAEDEWDPYTAAKHGVIGLTKSAALDYAPSGVRINAVCPGIIATEMMDRFTGGTTEGRDRVIAQEPIGRMGTADEIAAAVLWLCSDAAAFVVGHAMVIDGGQTVGPA